MFASVKSTLNFPFTKEFRVAEASTLLALASTFSSYVLNYSSRYSSDEESIRNSSLCLVLVRESYYNSTSLY